MLLPPVEPSQYTSVAFTQRLIDQGVDPSVGSVGDALDNALAGTTVGSFKNELIRPQTHPNHGGMLLYVVKLRSGSGALRPGFGRSVV